MNLVVSVVEAESGVPVVDLTDEHISVIAIAGEFDGVEDSWKHGGEPGEGIGAWEPWPTAVFENPASAPGIYHVHVWHRSKRAGTGIWAVVVSRGADRGVSLSSGRFRSAQSNS